jgi:hypothetical protein
VCYVGFNITSLLWKPVDTNTADDVSREHVCGEVSYALDPVEETLPRGGGHLHTETEASHGWDMPLGISRTISR